MPGMDMTNAAAAATPAGNTADDMDTMHKAGVTTFVANAGKDKTFWRQPMAFTKDGDVKVFDLTCTEGKWEIEPGNAVDAMLYNGVVPAPKSASPKAIRSASSATTR